MCVCGWVGGSRPFLYVSTSFATSPCPEFTHPAGDRPRGAHKSLVPAVQWLCLLLRLPARAPVAANRIWQGHSRPRPAAPRPPTVALGTGCPPPCGRGEMLKTLAVPCGSLGGWRRGPRFIPGTEVYPKHPTPRAGWGMQTPLAPFPCSSILLYTPVRFSPLPPSLRVPPGALAGAQHRSTQLPINLGSAPCPPRPFLGFASTEDLSLKTSAWPCFGFRDPPCAVFCSGDYMQLLPLPLSLPATCWLTCRLLRRAQRACPGAKRRCLGLVQQVPWGNPPARHRDAGQVTHPPR